MPCDIGDTECYQNFTDICCKINALYSDVDAIHAIVGGDFNCQEGSRYYRAMHFSAKRGIAISCRLSVRLSVCL